jgi:uncharacterized protein (DUF736 family)
MKGEENPAFDVSTSFVTTNLGAAWKQVKEVTGA